MAAAAMLAAVLTACSVAVPGAPVRDTTVNPADANPALMKPGNYPTRPLGEPTPSRERAIIVDAQRMADYVVGPWEVDPVLVAPNPTATLALKSAESLKLVLLDPASAIARDRGFVNGFATDRSSAPGTPGGRKALGNTVLRFPDPAAATAAADDFANQLPSVMGETTLTPVAIPGHPEARASQTRLQDGTFTVTSYTPHGPYVLHQYARVQQGIDGAAWLVAKALDLQTGRIDGFTPTDPAQFDTMNLDPTGLLAKTLPSDDPTVNMGVWTARGVLHFQSDPFAAARIYGESGVDVVSHVKTTVYRTRDAAAAAALADELGIVFAGKTATPGPKVAGMPDARCFTSGDSGPLSVPFKCVAVADRWVFTATSKQEFDVTQQIAAQYLMLTGT